jgi:hypothetical protein
MNGNMMKTRLSVCVIAIVGAISVTNKTCGQAVVGGNQAKAMDMNTIPLGTISTFGFPEKVVTGSKYLFKEWRFGTMKVDAKEIKNIPMNIDVQNGVVEINTDRGIRVVPVHSVGSLTFMSANGNYEQSFVNVKQYAGEKVYVAGLFEVLVSDTITLLKHSYLVQKEGSYNAALDMGNNETKFMIKDRFFLHTAGGKIVEVPANKKKFLDYFHGEKQDKVEAFIKENKLNVKSQVDLAVICDFLNKEGVSI